MNISKISFAFFLFLLTGIVSCAVGGGDSDDDGGGGGSIGESTFMLTATTNDRGVAVVSFGVADGTTKFSVTAEVVNSGAVLRFTQLINERGVDYLFPSGPSVSLADAFSPFANTFSVPSRRQDPDIQDGDVFVASIEVEDVFGGSLAGENVRFTINGKQDTGLNGGSVNMNLFFVGDVGQDEETIRVVREATQTALSTYSGQAGININFNEVLIDGPVILPSPSDGSSFYRAASGAAPSLSINVFIGGDIGGIGIGGTVLGFASDIPGPPIPTERSGVAVSFFAGAGPDGIYDQEDIRLLGETIAHEAGHFAGLFHPIDFSGSSVAFVDPLPDTDSCSFVTECLSNPSLTRNLMYPSPVSDGSGSFVFQDMLSSDQRGVINRYISVD